MKLKFNDIILIVLFLLIAVIYFFPWQIVPSDELMKNLYVFSLSLAWVAMCLWVFFRIRKLQIKRKWLFGLILFAMTLPAVPNLVLISLYSGLPQEYNHYELYENVSDTNEKVMHIYYKYPMGGFWKFKHVIAVPKYDLRLERHFDHKNKSLSGIWKCNEWKNNVKYSKTVELKYGKEIRVLDELKKTD